MIILDTDCLSLFEREKHLEFSILRANLAHFESEDISTNIITYEEQIHGWLSYLAKCIRVEKQIWHTNDYISRLKIFVKSMFYSLTKIPQKFTKT
jgi:hypothetical protein